MTVGTGAIDFDKFFTMGNLFIKTIGLEIYSRTDLGHPQHSMLNPVFVLHSMIWLFVGFIEGAFMVVSSMDIRSFIEFTKSLSYMIFGVLSVVKIWVITMRKHRTTLLIRELRRLYPQNSEDQEDFDLPTVYRKFRINSVIYVISNQFFVWVYNLHSLFMLVVVDYWLNLRDVPKKLPFPCWVPWDYLDHWSFYLLYVLNMLAGYMSVTGVMVTDLVLGMVVTHIIMNLNHLAKRVKRYVVQEPTQHGSTNDRAFLTEVIILHDKILRLVDEMNGVFGITLLVNFATSAIIICITGFQLTIGSNMEGMLMVFLFLAYSMVQITLICNYGEELQTAGYDIGNAMFSHEWHKSDPTYRRTMCRVIQKAQRPIILKGTFLLNIRRATMTDLLQLSYKIFAVIRQIYSDQ